MFRTIQKSLATALVACAITAAQNAVRGNGEYEDTAWSVLTAGMHEKSTERRAQAVSSLDLLGSEPKAVAAAEDALHDPSSSVRVAAINALGEMNARASLPKIKALIGTADGKTLVAIGAVLRRFNDPEGYEIYYEILTGTRKAGGGLLAGIKDRKALERMGIEEAIGFVPFGGVGVGAYNYFRQNNSSNSSVLAISALALANDPDPATEKALIQASYDDRDPVKVAALRALAKRGDQAVISEIAPAMHSEKPFISYTAASAVLCLSRDNKHLASRGPRQRTATR